ncbi:MAG: hypothetical protein KY455_11195 [Euryarchaeota archaeon]|nr:hypothetical protein [Euryarchaeota archaeon]
MSPASVDVTLSTVEAVQSVLEKAKVPVSRNWILEELKKKGRGTVRQRLNRVLEYFFRLGLAVEGSKGVQWTHNESPSLRRASSMGREL